MGLSARVRGWFGLAARLVAVALILGVALGALLRSREPAEWHLALMSIPLREDAFDCGKVGEMRLVALPDAPVRKFGIEYDDGDVWPPSRSLAAPLFGRRASEPQKVQLPYSETGDDELQLISEAHSLQLLALDGTRITDAGLEHLGTLTRLESLTMGFTNISDRGVEVVASLGSLRFLDLRGTALTKRALAALGRLDRLEVLILSESRVADGGLDKLEGFPRLQSLNLEGTNVDDADIDALCGLGSLQHVNLCRTRITDAGIVKLAALKRLVEFHCEETAVTSAAVQELRAGLGRNGQR